MATHGDQGTRALIVAGAGSTAEFIGRAFPAFEGVVDEVLPIDPHAGDVEAISATLHSEVARARVDGWRVIIGGVSFGAHASAAYAADCAPDERPDGLACVMPAWTGEPDAIAWATASTASLLQEHGIPAVLDDLEARFPGDWVTAELRLAWGRRRADDLIAELRAVAACPSPSVPALARITMPTVVVGLADDPVHPVKVARAWAAAIPGSVLVTHARAEVGVERGRLGRSAFEALASEYQRSASASQ